MPPRTPTSSWTSVPLPPGDDQSCTAGSLPAPLRQLCIIAPAAINNLYLPLCSSHDVPRDAEGWLPHDSALQRCSAPATVILPVPGVLAPLWCVAKWRGQAGDNGEVVLPCTCSCAEPHTSYVPYARKDLEEEEGISGRETLFHYFCLQREEKNIKEEKKKKRQMSIFFSLQLMEKRRSCGNLSLCFPCLERKC